MNENVRILKEVAERYNLDFRSDYSGRGMYGRECVGVVTSNMATLLMVLGQKGFDVEQRVCTDNMGRDTIVYFPDLQDDPDDTDEDPDDEDAAEDNDMIDALRQAKGE